MDNFFDAGTLKHLDAWLDREIDGDDHRATVRAQMLAFAADDAEYWSCQSWTNLFDRAECKYRA